MSRQSEDELSANEEQPQLVTLRQMGCFGSQTLRQLALAVAYAGRSRPRIWPDGQGNEGESERWYTTVRSRQKLRGSVVLAVAGTKVTRRYICPDGRFWGSQLEVRLFLIWPVCSGTLRSSRSSCSVVNAQQATQIIMAV